jgi:hypothetical protein
VDSFIAGTEGKWRRARHQSTSKALGIEPAQLLAPADEVIE